MTTQKVKIVMFAPVCEWNDFVGFNGALHQLRKSPGANEALEDLVVVAPRKAFPIITEADSFITLHPDADNPNETYPAVLEEQSSSRLMKFGNQQVVTHGRNKSKLFDYAQAYIKSEPRFKDYQVRLFEQEVDLYSTTAVKVYTRLFNNLQRMIRDNVRIRPTKAVYDRVSSTYKHLTTPAGSVNKTVMVLTRNYANKAPAENTIILIPQMQKIIDSLVNAGVTVLNVGFPVQSYPINHPNYRELSNEDLSQDELVALMYDCDSVIMSGRSGGFAAHVLSNVDIIMAHQEWSVENKDINIEVFETRKAHNPDVASIDMSVEFEQGDTAAVVSTVLNHRKVAVNTFAQEKPVVYLK